MRLLASPFLPWLTAVVVALQGCSDKPREVVYDVTWYKEHQVEREATIKRCKNNPGELDKTPNCINVYEAIHQLFFQPPPPSDRSKNKAF